MYECIPKELKQLPNWVCWRYEQRGNSENKTKVPYSPHSKGQRAKSNSPASWGTFSAACNACTSWGMDGIGFQFGGTGLVGVDIDHCIENGKMTDTAAEIITTLESYTEYSPSGTGVHIICKGELPAGRRRRGAVEMYDGNAGRYFTMTGKSCTDTTTINKRNRELAAVHSKFLAEAQRQQRSSAPEQSPHRARPRASAKADPLTDDEIVEKILNQRGDQQRNAALWAGDWQAYYNSQSEADLALCNLLAFYACKDAATMDRIFHSSGLYRKKWDEKHGAATYGQKTIAEAIAGTTRVYDPPRHSMTPKKRNVEVVSPCGDFPFIDEKCRPIKECWENTEWLLNRYGYKLRYNKLSRNIEYTTQNTGNRFTSAAITDIQSFCAKHYLKLAKAMLADHLERIALKNAYNPYADYIIDCYNRWNGHSGLPAFWDCLALADEAEKDLLHVLFKKWLMCAAALAFNDSAQISPIGVLVLQGGQGIGKTSFVRWLMPIESLRMTGKQLDTSNKDSITEATSVAICELGELGSTLKDTNRLKAFFTNSSDTLRKPYATAAETFPRYTSFIGTVNETAFLRDSTGDRRYFVIPLKSIDLERLQALSPAPLWAEAYKLACVDKVQFLLAQDEIKQTISTNRAYQRNTDVEQIIFDSYGINYQTKFDPSQVEFWNRKTATDVALQCGIPATNTGQVGKVLAALAAAEAIPPQLIVRGTRTYKLPNVVLTAYENKSKKRLK